MRNLRFCLSIRKRKAAGFKKYPFWSAFLVIVFTGSCAQIPTASSQYCRDIWLELKLCWWPPLAVNIILFILKCWESLCRHGLNILSTGFLWMLAEYCDCLIVSFSSWDCFSSRKDSEVLIAFASPNLFQISLPRVKAPLPKAKRPETY